MREQNYEKRSDQENVVGTAEVSFVIKPLIDFIIKTAREREVVPDMRVMSYVLADIAHGLNCDRENEVNLLTEANSRLWEINRLFVDMGITGVTA